MTCGKCQSVSSVVYLPGGADLLHDMRRSRIEQLKGLTQQANAIQREIAALDRQLAVVGETVRDR